MRSLTVIILLFSIITANAQQLPQFSQYWNLLSFDNPAACGKNGTINAALVTRKQWLGFKGSPFTTSLVSDMLFKDKDFGIGFVTGYDIIGFYRTFESRIQGSYRLKVGAANINFGIETAFTNFRLHDPLWVSIDPVQQDPSIPSGSTNDYGIQFGSGLMFYTDDFYAGFSVRQLVASDYKNANYNVRPHYYLQSGYHIYINQSFHLLPTILVESDATSTAIAANLNYFINDKFNVGFGYRMTDAIMLNFGYNIKQWNFGYSFDLPISKIQNYSKGSHEVFVKFFLNKDKGTIIQ